MPCTVGICPRSIVGEHFFAQGHIDGKYRRGDFHVELEPPVFPYHLSNQQDRPL